MNVKKYRAADSDQAMRMIRLAHGADVAILDCYSVPGGVEVVVSLDALPAVAPADNDARPSFATQYAEITGSQKRLPELPGTTPQANATTTTRERQSQAADAAAGAPQLAWSQDEELLSMKQEMAAMKAMLFEQLKDQGWQQADRRTPRQRALNRFMAAVDIDPELARQFADMIPEAEDERLQREMFKSMLINRLPVKAPPSQGAICLVGPQGAGKTTSIAKLAAQYVMRYGRKDIAVLTTDMARVGAQEQLRAYGRILQIPIHTVVSQAEAVKTYRMLQNKAMVLVDTSGYSFRDREGLQELNAMLSEMPDLQVFLSLPADTEAYVQSEIIDAYSVLPLQGALISRIDETMRLGPILSNLIQHRLPAVWCSNGPKVPRNLSAADAEKLVGMAVKMARVFENSKSDTQDRTPAVKPAAGKGGAISVLG